MGQLHDGVRVPGLPVADTGRSPLLRRDQAVAVMSLAPGEPPAGRWRAAPSAELVDLVQRAAGTPVGRPLVVAVDGRGAGAGQWPPVLRRGRPGAAEAERRGIARDVDEGVTGDVEETTAFWHGWMNQELPLVADQRPWERARVVVAGTPTAVLDATQVLLAPPPPSTSPDEVLAVLDDVRRAGGRRAAGGWGVDALVGRQTRTHLDLDLAVDATSEAVAVELLRQRGYAVETDWRPVRVELAAPGRGRVDLHPVVVDATGHGRQEGVSGAHFDDPPGPSPRECPAGLRCRARPASSRWRSTTAARCEPRTSTTSSCSDICGSRHERLGASAAPRSGTGPRWVASSRHAAPRSGVARGASGRRHRTRRGRAQGPPR